MKRENLPIWRSCQQQLTEVENAVRGFSRYHKYTQGTQLRQCALDCCRLLIRALNAKGSNRLRWVGRLQSQCDELKLLIQLGKDCKIFASFSQFQRLAELAVSVSKQVGHWHRALSHSKPRAESV